MILTGEVTNGHPHQQQQIGTTMTSEEIKAEYTSSLADLTFNSKPLINVLTILAEENLAHASDIVAAIEEHLAKVQTDVKLPILYLIDCIAKNIGGTYTTLFSQNIVSTFCNVFKLVDERTRAEMFKLRQTWNDVFPQKKLYAIDVQINMLDPAWPVTAPPPSNSIHLNPKFLMSNQTNSSKSKKIESKPSVSETPTVLDTETFTMQQKLIQKQKELIELQQKKLELELLQTQVKLQKQLKNSPQTALVTNNLLQNKPQNILLKPEVAKQILASEISDGVKPKQMENMLGKQGNVPKIAPASSVLVAAATATVTSVATSTSASTLKPIRDPRLLRQQLQKSDNSDCSSNQLGSKSPILDSNNKVLTSKMSVRENRNEPRTINNNNKDVIMASSTIPISQCKIDTVGNKPKLSSPKSNNSKNDTVKSSSSSSSSSNNSKSRSNNSKSDSYANVKNSDAKNKSAKSGDNKLSNKHKKKDAHSDNKKNYSKDSKMDRDKNRNKGGGSSSQITFKGIKGSTKNRNYMRRNRSSSITPERDVDFRLGAPAEKLPRLQPEPEEKRKSPIELPAKNAKYIFTTANKNLGNQSKDIDLRQLPASVAKKRSSTENLEQNVSKKTKTEIFDVLFGNEDTDLRKLPVIQPDRPPTPPPPIISSAEGKENPKEKKDSPKKNLDAVRAKLANATNREKVMSKSFHKKHPQRTEDEDLRLPQVSSGVEKIIIPEGFEQRIKSGTLTKEDQNKLMSKLVAKMEHQKLREAKLKDDDEDDVEEEDAAEKRGDGAKDDPSFHGSKYRGEARRTGTGSTSGGSTPYWRNSASGSATSKRRHWDNAAHVTPTTRPGIRPWANSNINPWRPMASNFNRFQTDFVPPRTLSPSVLEQDGSRSPECDLYVDSVNHDDVKTINIDGIPRDIRYYDETAIVFMDWDDPREISFQNDTRRVIFDDKDAYVLGFNEPYKQVEINGTLHGVRLGAPSREIFIDGKPYECYFGGPGITIDLDSRMTTVVLEGPPPHVKIGQIKRTDLVAGKVSLIIDAKTIVPVFLDAKIQKFVIDGETHSLKFVDALQTVLINDVRFNVEFGGLPKPITVHDKKHFIRFSVLPRGVRPGYVDIYGMEGIRLPSINDDNNSQDALLFNLPTMAGSEPVVDTVRRPDNDDFVDRNSNSPHLFQSFMQQNNLDMLSSALSSATNLASGGGYQVENLQPKLPETIEQPAPPPPTNPLAQLPSTININDLFQKLVATGIVATKDDTNELTINSNANPANEYKKRNPLETLKAVTFERPQTLKNRQSALYELLYSGMQCSSCGMRFPPEQSMHYSQHLDWHFRQNRKGKKNIRVAASRRWYYSLADWKNYEEIEDLEEREKNYFDQQNQVEGTNEEAEEETEIPSVPADPYVQDARCEVCRDRFDQFFNEEKEEWHLKNAIRMDDKTYHPLCFDDYQESLLQPIEEKNESVEMKKNEESIPGLEIVVDDDDDDDDENDDRSPENETKDTEEKSLDEVVIEETTNDEKADEETENSEETKKDDVDEDEDDDDDVIIDEVVPERIELDDDDEDDYENMDHIERTESLPQQVTIKIEKNEEFDDGFVDVEEGLRNMQMAGQIRIKSEPIDEDEVEPPELQVQDMFVPPTSTPALISSIDGNVEHESTASSAPAPTLGGKIKINITKPLPSLPSRDANKEVNSGVDSAAKNDIMIDPSQPPPPGEERIQLNVKPALQGVELKKLPAVRKGSELTGMCAIM